MMVRILNKLYRKFLLGRIAIECVKNEQIHEEKLVLENFESIKMAALSKEEIAQVDKVYGTSLGSYRELALFKKYKGFDPRYLSHYAYLPIIAHKLNDYHYTKMLEHKSLQGYVARGEMKHPFCYVRSVNREYYSDCMQQLSLEQAIRECIKHNTLIIKDSLDSAGGKSVEKLDLSDKNESARKKEVERVFQERKCDFVIQECIKQHPSMAKFNPASINTLRVTTLYLNGKFSVLSIVLRFGKEGMNVDNWGAGGILIGVDEKGKLHNVGYDIRLNEFKEYHGVVFSDETLTQVPALLKAIEHEHTTCYSLSKFIGWDICFNEANEPVIIELNSSQPGVIGEQLCTGPIFGERTQEVMEYCNNKKFIYHKSIFQY